MKAWVVISAVALVWGCSKAETVPTGQTPEPGGPTVEQPEGRLPGLNCDTAADCQPGAACTAVTDRFGPRNICTRACSTDADCEERMPSCGLGPDDSSMCVWSCPAADGVPFGFACVDDAAVACGTDHSLCEQCGCPADKRCVVGVDCIDKVAVGEACEADSDCESSNCGSTKICRDRVGTPCTPGTCDRCNQPASGETWCSRFCEDDAQCSGSTVCLLSTGLQGSGICYRRCTGPGDPVCPETCQLSGGDELDFKVYFCQE